MWLVVASGVLAVGGGSAPAGAQTLPPPTRPPVTRPPATLPPPTSQPPPTGQLPPTSQPRPTPTPPPPTLPAPTTSAPSPGDTEGSSTGPLVAAVLLAAAAGGGGFLLARRRGAQPTAGPTPAPATRTSHAADDAAGGPGALTHELLEVSRLLTTAATSGDVKRATVRGALSLVPADGAAVVSVDSGQGLAVATESTPGLLVPEQLGDGVLKRVAETGDVVDLRSASEPAIRNRPASVLALPLVAGGRVAAVLVVVRGQELPFTAAETRTLRALAPMAAAALQSERQTQSAIEDSLLDPLTGANTRRRFDRDLAAALAPSATGGPVSLAIVDLDHFKRVNDTHGHPAGDALLKAVVQRITTAVRPGDGVYRFGGEEFCLLLADTTTEVATDVAERVRHAVAEQPFDIGAAERLPATASIGVATATAADDPAAILGRADAALYEAKERGRNRVVVSPR
jgi:diguanylate cyclase (GGDEF)-like protein